MSQQTSSDSTGRPKFTLHNSKLQVYADNAIKRSNVKAFVNQGMKSSERLNLENNLNKNLSHHLLHLKNSCNDLKKDITGKENDATRMKDQTMYTSQKVKELQSQREKLQAKIMNLTKDVEKVHKKKQATFHSFKTYEHILWRMKKDEITNQIRKNNLQKLTINLEKQLKIIQNKLYSLNEYQELSFKGLRQAEQQIQQQGQHRQKKVNQLNSVLEEKKISEIKKQQRHNQTKSIQEMAAGDLQDADLIRMKKFLQVQVFLKCLLKEKMQRLKDYFEPYEMAFFKIKSQTSAKDANSLKTQFFNFQSQYQQRTAWIKHLEEEISGLEIERKQLNQDLCKAKERQLDLLEQFEDPNPKIYDAQHYDQNSQADKDSIWKRSLDSELTAMKVKQWINFQSKKVSMATNTQGEHTAAVAANFNKICDFLLQNKKQQAAKKNISQQPSKGNEEVKV